MDRPVVGSNAARSLALKQKGAQVKIRFILALTAVIIAVILAPPWMTLP